MAAAPADRHGPPRRYVALGVVHAAAGADVEHDRSFRWRQPAQAAQVPHERWRLGAVEQRQHGDRVAPIAQLPQSIEAFAPRKAGVPIAASLRPGLVHGAARAAVLFAEEGAAALALQQLVALLSQRIRAGIAREERLQRQAEEARQPLRLIAADQRLPAPAADAATEAGDRLLVGEAAESRVEATLRLRGMKDDAHRCPSAGSRLAFPM